MQMKVKDLTVDELKMIISDSIKENMQEISEDLIALSSKNYLDSIVRARKDYKDGKYITLEEILWLIMF